MLGFSRAFCHSVWGLQSNSGGRMGRGAGYAFVMSVWMMRSASCKSWRCCSDRNESLRYTHCCREATRTFDTNFPTGRWLPGWDPQHVASNPGAALVCHRGGQSGRRGHWKSKYSTIIWYRFLDDIVCMIMYVYLYCTCFGCFFWVVVLVGNWRWWMILTKSWLWPETAGSGALETLRGISPGASGTMLEHFKIQPVLK